MQLKLKTYIIFICFQKETLSFYKEKKQSLLEQVLHSIAHNNYIMINITQFKNDNKNMIIKLYILIISLCVFHISISTPVVLSGGEVTINGIITTTQIDISVNYTANVKWLAIIFSSDEVNTDLHLLVREPSDAARPVKVYDCYLDQNSYIKKDDIDNIMPSVTGFWGDGTYGIKMSYNRDLNTNDLQDVRLYGNTIIQLCFISSLQAYVGGGFQKGNTKICSYFTLHDSLNQYQDRLLGNYAATVNLGGANLTIYATQSTESSSTEPWLFLGIVHKQQGLTPFVGKWIGVTYNDSLINADMAVVEYGLRNFLTQVNVLDMFAVNSTYAKQDLSYTVDQGSADDFLTLGGVKSGGYMVGTFKRKFSTGDINRDTIVTPGTNKFCFLLGNNWAYTTFTYTQRICLNLTLATSYKSYFRVSSNSGPTPIVYVKPPNTVVIVKWNPILLVIFLNFIILFLAF